MIMKLKNLMMPLAALALVVSSCDKKTDKTEPATETTTTKESSTEVTPAVYGTYEGVIPCADCPGIKTTITLNEDGSYERTEKYLEKEDSDDSSNGEIVWSDNFSKVTLGDYSYMVKENQLILLDAEGKAAEGELADKYILNKK